jgi:hypothetical protein
VVHCLIYLFTSCYILAHDYLLFCSGLFMRIHSYFISLDIMMCIIN